MLISELAKAVHENAVAHGWWDDDREAPEIIALIHSEWSEALEEARADRPLIWYAFGESNNSLIVCNPQDDYECRMYGREKECEYRQNKPEGIAVELIDGCIRILDYAGKLEAEFTEKDGSPSSMESLYSDSNVAKTPDNVAHLLAYLHLYTSQAFAESNALIPCNMLGLTNAMAAALSWVKKQGLDPLAILLEKHEYNKTRPYKHGKKF